MAGPLNVPAADHATSAVLVVEQDRPVVGLTSWLARAHAAAAGSGRVLCLVTGPAARVTFPLETLMSEAGLRWVVVSGDHVSDGLTGRQLRWDAERFVEDPEAMVDLPPAPSLAGPGSVRVDVSVRHPGLDGAGIAGLVGVVLAETAGATPIGWGVCEPVSEPWQPDEVAALVRERVPAATTVVVTGAARSGAGPVGILNVSHLATGVVERLWVTVGSDDGPDLAGLDRLADALAGQGVAVMSATWQPGRADATRGPHPVPAGLPLGVLTGPGELAPPDVDQRVSSAQHVEATLGPPEVPCRWRRISEPPKPLPSFAEVLAHADPPP